MESSLTSQHVVVVVAVFLVVRRQLVGGIRTLLQLLLSGGLLINVRFLLPRLRARRLRLRSLEATASRMGHTPIHKQERRLLIGQERQLGSSIFISYVSWRSRSLLSQVLICTFTDELQ